MSDTDDELELLALVRLRNRAIRKRAYGVHPLRRDKRNSQFATLFKDLSIDDREFRMFTRMTPASFTELLQRVGPLLQKRSIRTPVSAEQRLLITLRYLATGESFRSLAFAHYLGRSTVASVVHETCKAVVEALKPEFLRTPSTPSEWAAVADAFWQRWNIPNMLGAVDGKHIRVRKPANSGTLFHNYKSFFSVVVMAVADASMRIIYLSVGSYGHEGDGGIFDRCDLARAMNDNGNPLGIPAPSLLPGTNTQLPYFFVGDDAFPIKEWMMKPYAMQGLTAEQRIFNYRLSRARRIVESTFGLLAGRWRLLLRPIEAAEHNLDAIVEAACCLHNFLTDRSDASGVETVDRGAELPPADSLNNPHANHATQAARDNRTTLLAFFNGIGAVPWQWEM